MCYFLKSEIHEIHEDVPEDKPIYGYKIMRARGVETRWSSVAPHFASQVMGDEWKYGRMSTRRKKQPGTGPRSVAGIYAYKKRDGRRYSSGGYYCVKVALWGRVIEYLDAPCAAAGFRAQYAKIVAVYDVYGEHRKAIRKAAPHARIYPERWK